jgi:uncharacterized protein YndB with AHSA1/START domain
VGIEGICRLPIGSAAARWPLRGVELDLRASFSSVDQTGYLLIADITGYTTYLSGSELDHADKTLSSLLELLISETPPPLIVAQLEGDAVMSYALGERMPSGQTFIESIEAIYVEFRRALEMMVLNTSCDCNACANISNLDLKFFVHHGFYRMQPVLDREQLVGTDVNFIHRLLKNSVTRETGITAYLLLTDPARTALGIDADAGWLRAHIEEVADFGEVETWIRDMQPAFASSKDSDRSFYDVQDVWTTLSTDIAAPRELVWDHLRDSSARNVILGSDSYQIEDTADGWVGEGSTYLCYHGKSVLPQLILEWSPPRRLVIEELLPMPGRPTQVILDFTLEANSADSTRLTLVVTKPSGPPVQRALAKAWMRRTGSNVEQALGTFGDLIVGVGA